MLTAAGEPSVTDRKGLLVCRASLSEQLLPDTQYKDFVGVHAFNEMLYLGVNPPPVALFPGL